MQKKKREKKHPKLLEKHQAKVLVIYSAFLIMIALLFGVSQITAQTKAAMAVFNGILMIIGALFIYLALNIFHRVIILWHHRHELLKPKHKHGFDRITDKCKAFCAKMLPHILGTLIAFFIGVYIIIGLLIHLLVGS